jgi:hypothetical protein
MEQPVPEPPNPEPNTELAMVRYFDLGMQYYVAGRYSVFAGLAPVCGNLLHHAVEMFLKGYVAHRARPSLRRKKFRHRLPELWQAFKAEVGEQEPNRLTLLCGRSMPSRGSAIRVGPRRDAPIHRSGRAVRRWPGRR